MSNSKDDNRINEKRINETVNADDLINQIKDGLDITEIKTPRYFNFTNNLDKSEVLTNKSDNLSAITPKEGKDEDNNIDKKEYNLRVCKGNNINEK